MLAACLAFIVGLCFTTDDATSCARTKTTDILLDKYKISLLHSTLHDSASFGRKIEEVMAQAKKSQKGNPPQTTATTAPINTTSQHLSTTAVSLQPIRATAFGSDGRRLINDGGEGYIYEIQGSPDKLVKIYKETDSTGAPIVTAELHAKLRFMRDNPPDILISKGIVAWPTELVYEQDKLMGYYMPKLDFHEHIQRTYSYRHPQLEASDYERFPSIESRIKIAINLCSAIDELHRKGYVFGDFNHHNVGVNYSTGQICFMDCDSFHITDNKGVVFRTNVIMAGYLAPEIIAHCNRERSAGRPNDLDKVALPTFTRESDLFCLAIHIFKLLMNGVDPFRGVKFDSVGSTASPFIGNEAIERDSYVFKPGNKPSAIFCPPADSLPQDILSLFNRTFIDGRNDPTIRASAADWYIVLNRYLANELAQCPNNTKHQYYRYLQECPYCSADNRHLNEQSGYN